MSDAVLGTAVVSDTGNTGTNTSLVCTRATTTAGQTNLFVVLGYTTSGPGVAMGFSLPGSCVSVQAEHHATAGTPTPAVFAFSADGTVAPTVHWTAAGQAVCIALPCSNLDATTPFPFTAILDHASGTVYTISGTTGSDAVTIVSGSVNKSGAAYTGLTDTVDSNSLHASALGWCVQHAAASTAASTGFSKTMNGPSTTIGISFAIGVKGAAAAATAAMTSVSALAGAASLVGLPAAAMTSVSALAGIPVATVAGSATMASATAFGGAVTTQAQQWVIDRAGGRQLGGHRDGVWGVYGEETMEGYTAAAAYHSGLALEISLNVTSDGVPVCSHDSTTGRVFSGTNQTISAVPWSTLSPGGAFVTAGRPTTLVGGNVMRRVEEILDAFPTRIFVIDNKPGTNSAALIAILDAHAPGRWIAKGTTSQMTWLNAAGAGGRPAWCFFYPADIAAGQLSTVLAAWTGTGQLIYGIGDFSTTGSTLPIQSDVTTFLTFTAAHSIMTWAHILGASSQKTTADGYATTAGHALDGYMMSNVPNVIASDAGTASMTSVSALAGAATRTQPATAAMTSVSSFGGAAIAVDQAAASMTSSTALTGSAAVVEQAAATMSSTSALAGTGTATDQAASGMTSVTALSGTAGATDQATGAMTSATALSGAGVVPGGSTAAMTSGTSLAGVSAAQLVALATMQSMTALTGAGTVDVPTVTPPERTFSVPARSRTYTAPARPRTYTWRPE